MNRTRLPRRRPRRWLKRPRPRPLARWLQRIWMEAKAATGSKAAEEARNKALKEEAATAGSSAGVAKESTPSVIAAEYESASEDEATPAEAAESGVAVKALDEAPGAVILEAIAHEAAAPTPEPPAPTPGAAPTPEAAAPVPEHSASIPLPPAPTPAPVPPQAAATTVKASTAVTKSRRGSLAVESVVEMALTNELFGACFVNLSAGSASESLNPMQLCILVRLITKASRVV